MFTLCFLLNSAAEEDAVPLSQLFPPNTPTAAAVQHPDVEFLLPDLDEGRVLAEVSSSEETGSSRSSDELA
jgi:hypothetical protein